MRITYLEHSGFVVEMATHCIVFDYIKGDIPDPCERALYVFVSHAHADHYQPAIFDLRKKWDNVHYILSDDIHCEADDVIFVHAGDELMVDDIKIKALPSTDVGVAYLLQVEQKGLYHSGDLNWWHWQEINSDEANKQAKQAYLDAISALYNKHIHVAFAILDPRQEEQFAYGFDALMRQCDIDYVFPMHMWGDYAIIKELKTMAISKPYREKIMEIHHAQETFTLPCFTLFMNE